MTARERAAVVWFGPRDTPPAPTRAQRGRARLEALAGELRILERFTGEESSENVLLAFPRR